MSDMIWLEVCTTCGGLIDGEYAQLEPGEFPCLCGHESQKPNEVEDPWNKVEGGL